jgi:hypothetical protein
MYRKQMRECKSQREIRERLQATAGILTESNHAEDDVLEIEGMLKSELKDLIRDMVREYFNETFDEPQQYGEEEEEDLELERILAELELELK